jgi:hypothetical protein
MATQLVRSPYGFQQDHSSPITPVSLLPNSSPVYDWALVEDPSLASEYRELSPVRLMHSSFVMRELSLQTKV